MTVYLDTSVVLRVLFGQGPAWKGWGRWTEAWTSELMGVEARRTIDRLRLEGALDDPGVALAQQMLGVIERSIGLIALSKTVLRRASLPMATSVKTLDAIHLATAMLYAESRDEALHFATHDQQQAQGAKALGLDVVAISD